MNTQAKQTGRIPQRIHAIAIIACLLTYLFVVLSRADVYWASVEHTIGWPWIIKFVEKSETSYYLGRLVLDVIFGVLLVAGWWFFLAALFKSQFTLRRFFVWPIYVAFVLLLIRNNMAYLLPRQLGQSPWILSRLPVAWATLNVLLGMGVAGWIERVFGHFAKR